jgi:hypothetical protein
VTALPLPIAAVLGGSIVGLAYLMYVVWDRNPNRVQSAVVQPLRKLRDAVHPLFRLCWKLAALLASIAMILVMTPVYAFAAIAWTLLRTVTGEPAKVLVKFS